MPENPNSHNNGTKRYPPELKEHAVRMVLETIEKTGERSGAEELEPGGREAGFGDYPGRDRPPRTAGVWVAIALALVAAGLRVV
jgi:hypothetical protein